MKVSTYFSYLSATPSPFLSRTSLNSFPLDFTSLLLRSLYWSTRYSALDNFPSSLVSNYKYCLISAISTSHTLSIISFTLCVKKLWLDSGCSRPRNSSILTASGFVLAASLQAALRRANDSWTSFIIIYNRCPNCLNISAYPLWFPLDLFDCILIKSK